jgi:hypothetical protein
MVARFNKINWLFPSLRSCIFLLLLFFAFMIVIICKIDFNPPFSQFLIQCRTKVHCICYCLKIHLATIYLLYRIEYCFLKIILTNGVIKNFYRKQRVQGHGIHDIIRRKKSSNEDRFPLSKAGTRSRQ